MSELEGSIQTIESVQPIQTVEPKPTKTLTPQPIQELEPETFKFQGREQDQSPCLNCTYDIYALCYTNFIHSLKAHETKYKLKKDRYGFEQQKLNIFTNKIDDLIRNARSSTHTREEEMKKIIDIFRVNFDQNILIEVSFAGNEVVKEVYPFSTLLDRLEQDITYYTVAKNNFESEKLSVV